MSVMLLRTTGPYFALQVVEEPVMYIDDGGLMKVVISGASGLVGGALAVASRGEWTRCMATCTQGPIGTKSIGILMSSESRQRR